MENNGVQTILSIDAGGLKGIYSAFILNGIQGLLNTRLPHFNIYIGTSIGAVITAAIASGMSPENLISDFLTFKEKLDEGHAQLTVKLFEWIDDTFKDSRLCDIEPNLFIPVYNHTNKARHAFTKNNDPTLKLKEALKAACSDIRTVSPYYMEQLNCHYSDAGYFAYDPILYYVETEKIDFNNKIKILSIGSGVIENITDDLSMGASTDIIYDTFLESQFYTTQIFFKEVCDHSRTIYCRISEFPIKNAKLEEIPALAYKKLSSLPGDFFTGFN